MIYVRERLRSRLPASGAVTCLAVYAAICAGATRLGTEVQEGLAVRAGSCYRRCGCGCRGIRRRCDGGAGSRGGSYGLPSISTLLPAPSLPATAVSACLDPILMSRAEIRRQGVVALAAGHVEDAVGSSWPEDRSRRSEVPKPAAPPTAASSRRWASKWWRSARSTRRSTRWTSALHWRSWSSCRRCTGQCASGCWARPQSCAHGSHA